jgi:hypothetical protein
MGVNPWVQIRSKKPNTSEERRPRKNLLGGCRVATVSACKTHRSVFFLVLFCICTVVEADQRTRLKLRPAGPAAARRRCRSQISSTSVKIVPFDVSAKEVAGSKKNCDFVVELWPIESGEKCQLKINLHDYIVCVCNSSKRNPTKL